SAKRTSSCRWPRACWATTPSRKSAAPCANGGASATICWLRAANAEKASVQAHHVQPVAENAARQRRQVMMVAEEYDLCMLGQPGQRPQARFGARIVVIDEQVVGNERQGGGLAQMQL